MNLKILTRLVFGVLLIGFVTSCIEDNEYVPPTYEEEMALLDEYIDTLQNRGYNIESTDFGIYYAIDSVGEGDFPIYGDTCEVRYVGKFMDGTIFDASGNYTFEVVLGENQVIEGWEYGLQLFNKNAQGHLIIPSEFAYGSTGIRDSYGNYAIPPNTTIVFNIEMVEIKQGY